jgi:FkbM family methyltransferase
LQDSAIIGSGRVMQQIAFILAASDHGPMIVNRLDYAEDESGAPYGVGCELLQTGAFAHRDVGLILQLLAARRHHFGDGVVAIDGGANIGVHSVEWARFMQGWGSVISVEPQERLYYALAGNIALNNCFNARAVLAALTEEPGPILVPVPDYQRPGSFGSLELKAGERAEFIGQPIDYREEAMQSIAGISIDSLSLKRLDLIKLDIEGIEIERLRGASESLVRSRPVLFVEHLKVDRVVLQDLLIDLGYRVYEAGINLIAIHTDDPTLLSVAETWGASLGHSRERPRKGRSVKPRRSLRSRRPTA